MLIGALAHKSGFPRDAIRYYEKRGLLEPRAHRRRGNNYKEYSDQALQRLLCIRQLKEHGFSLSEIRSFLELWESTQGCEGIPDRVEDKLGQIDAQIARLQGFREGLASILSRCGGANCTDTPGEQATRSNTP